MIKKRMVLFVGLLCSCSVTTLNLQIPPYQKTDTPQTSQSTVVVEKTIEVPKLQIVKEPFLVKGNEVKVACPRYQLPKQPNLTLPSDISNTLKTNQTKAIEVLLKHIQDLHQYTADVNKSYSQYSNACKN